MAFAGVSSAIESKNLRGSKFRRLAPQCDAASSSSFLASTRFREQEFCGINCGMRAPLCAHDQKHMAVSASSGRRLSPPSAFAARPSLLKMAAPARRVFALPPAVSCREVEYFLYAATDAARRLRLRCPNGLDNPRDVAGVHGRDREAPDHRVSVGRERVCPLVRMLRILPPRPVPLNEPLGARLERIDFASSNRRALRAA